MTDARRPRVAIVRHDLFPGEPHLRRSVHTLRDAGFDVDVFCDREPNRPRWERLEGVTVRRILFQHKRHSVLRYLFEYATLPFLAAAIVAAQSLRHRYDYVEVDNPPDWLVLAGLIPRLQGATVVLYMFENMPELMAADRGWRPDQARMRALVKAQYLSARLAHRLIAPHEMARHILVDQGIPPEKIAAVVPNVPDERVFLPGNQDQPAPVTGRSGPHAPGGSMSSGFRLVTHGTLLQRYGIETLLEAAARLRDHIPGLHLEILGNGEYRPGLERLATGLDLGNCVTFSDRVPFGELASRLAAASVGIVPMWAPFVPNKLMEYLALRLPVVASDWPSLRLCFDDSAIYYVEPKNAQALADAILTLYRDPQRRVDLAANGHAAYRATFAWDRTKYDYLAVYGVAPIARFEEQADGGTTLVAGASG